MLARTCLIRGLLLVAACSAGPKPGSPSPEERADAPSSSTPDRTTKGDDTPTAPTTAASSPPAPSSPAPVACRKSVCLTGAVDHESGSNSGFRKVCESGVARGRIDDCRSDTCKSTWGTFPGTSTASVWNAVFAALDTNKDGLIDTKDTACELDVLGFSWGGVNALDLARRMNQDARVVAARRVVHRLVVLDAYQPGASLAVPANVLRAVSLRRSIAPPTDCSNTGPFGPYLGIAPRCTTASSCRDFDFSLSPDATFDGIRGKDVGHCSVPAAAAAVVAQFLADQPLTGPPKEVPVLAP